MFSKRLTPSRPRPRRRGVVLLVVLSLLVLFVLLIVTFVLVAGREYSTTKEYARIDRSGDAPKDVLDAIAMTLIRDTADPHSPFRGHSLLEGIYGNFSFRGMVGGTQQVAGGQMLTISVTNNSGGSPPSPAVWTYSSSSGGWSWAYSNVFSSQQANYYRGCVLTMISGKCAGLSARVVASDPQSLTVMQLIPDDGVSTTPSNNDVFILNAPPYSGMGRGFDTSATPAGTACGAKDPNGWEYALLPNSAFFQPNGSYVDPAGPGGANVDYTAPDFNSVYLGMVGYDATGKFTVIPSFHRPDLCKYWVQKSGGTVPDALAQKISFRPYAKDHPTFYANTSINGTGFDNTSFTQTYDVDNLGLGVPDSIWIDPGYPVMTNRDGKTYKIMVAPLILDMDCRLNLNADGSYTQIDPGANVSFSGTLAGGANSATLPVGMGTGPGGINPIQPNLLTQADMQAIISGNGNYQGRHGTGNSPIAARGLTALRFYDHPLDNYSKPPATAFGSPVDVRDRGGIGIDPRGNPIWMRSAPKHFSDEVFGFNNNVDCPYGIDFGFRVPRPGRQVPQGLDNPFTVAELERVLRQYDSDATSMPVRLYSLLSSSLQSNPALMLKVTVESWDVPTTSLAVPKDLRGATPGGPAAFNFADLISAKLGKTSIGAKNNYAELIKLLPAEVMAGLKMDLNRPFGNGRNDRSLGQISGTPQAPYPPTPMTAGSDHGIVDEAADGAKKSLPGAAGLPNWPTAFPGNYPLNLTATMNSSADPLIANNAIPPGWKQRQLMARYLYVMMVAFSDVTNTKWINPSDKIATQNAQELTSRRIAQWAINAVCFRDSTSAMTPFVYHANLFQSGYNGWQVNGDPGDKSQKQAISDWRVVWGGKPPDLVLTETLAFHDFRVADTDKDDGKKSKTSETDPAKKDPDYDQTRVPQGSTFIELYCTRNPNNPIAPGDLYSLINNQWYLDLGRMSADGQYPVWRMAISQSTKQSPQADMVNNLQQYPDTVGATSYVDPNGTLTDTGAICPQIQVNSVDTQQQVKIERMIWLGNMPPPQAQRTSQNPSCAVFYNRNKQIATKKNSTTDQTYVPSGGYAVVGPRAVTYIGAKNPGASGPYGTPSGQAISLYPSVATTGTANDMTPPGAVGVVVAADPPSGWTNAAHTTWGVGLNVTEPLPVDPALYYPEPTESNTAISDPIAGGNVIDAYGDLTGTDATKLFKDHPMDIGSGDTQAANRPLAKDGINKTGTVQRYKTVFLQRLADPTLPFDALRNPYITVDWMPIDVTIFNGEEDPAANSMGMPSGNPDDPNAADPSVDLYARQRGGSDPKNAPMQKAYNVWSPVNQNDGFPTQKQAKAGNGNFPYQAGHSLGYLNLNFGPPGNNGDPQKPFPWITWNARPYISPYELMLVPASSPDRLLAEFSTLEAYADTAPPAPYQPYDTQQQNVRGPFAHLLNFYNSADSSYTAGTASNFFRIFDYVTVPSKFIGTETVLNPGVFSGNNNNVPPWLLAPFNTVSNYRDPGRINLNTLASGEVYNALMNQPAAPKPSFSDWVDSRRGDGQQSGSIIPAGFGGSLPTIFARPLRSASSADLVPIQAMLPQHGVDVTLLRPQPGAGTLPLFMSSKMDGTSDPKYADAARHPYFAYQTLNRVANNVTGRSNVFGIWLTIGYFEAIPNSTGIDKGHPDGYQLGAELGSDNGTVERHRAFYMFDRSIPVGYERGQNHNVNRALLLKRFIE